MQKTFMGGFGVINKTNIQARRPAFALLGELLDYPTPTILTKEFYEEAATSFAQLPEQEMLLTELRRLQQLDFHHLQESYCDLFELNKKITLYTTYYKMEDSKERGTVLAKLKLLYEMFGASLEQPELADYLPAMLEFLAYGDFDGEDHLNELAFYFGVLEDGTFEILQAAKEEAQQPYIHLLLVTRNLLRDCVMEQEVTA